MKNGAEFRAVAARALCQEDDSASDQEWELKGRQDVEMCRCGHKKALHSSATVGTSMAAYPGYWTLPPQMSESEATKEFNQLLKQSESELARKVQNLINRTYSDVTTRDRKNHCKTWEVPRDFTLKEVFRNENSKNWRKYTIRRAELQQEKRSLKEMQDKKQETFEYHLFNTKTTENWEDADRHELVHLPHPALSVLNDHSITGFWRAPFLAE
eukprot:6476421-Amphidinium_carterae.1